MSLLLYIAVAASDAQHPIAIQLDLPDPLIVEAFERAATQNVLAAVNPDIFFGYWCVCADGQGFGYGNTYPALDGHQMADALLWLGQVDVVKANWDYVRSFQRPNGQLPFAILPDAAGKNIGPEGAQARVDDNGGLYKHWVPGDPLRALSYTTYVQNADVLFGYTQDRAWLKAQMPSVNLALDYLASLMADDGAVGGAGYYVERPTRVEYDGITQCYAIDAFRRGMLLNWRNGDKEAEDLCRERADRVEKHFLTRFWVGDHFAEYVHPEKGLIAKHGLTDVDWAAIAMCASREQRDLLWPKLRNEPGFRYGGMPTAIATRPEAYEDWEFTYGDRMDLAAMGRVWYLESWARANMNDGDGLVDSIRRVCEEGRKNGYYWRERYNGEGGYGAEKYCEYPANLIRIVERFLLGVDRKSDGRICLSPAVADSYWDAGFGQTMTWNGRKLTYRMTRGSITGEYTGREWQGFAIQLRPPLPTSHLDVTVEGAGEVKPEEGWLVFNVLGSPRGKSRRFSLTWTPDAAGK